jgi:hypothetical protein
LKKFAWRKPLSLAGLLALSLIILAGCGGGVAVADRMKKGRRDAQAP